MDEAAIPAVPGRKSSGAGSRSPGLVLLFLLAARAAMAQPCVYVANLMSDTLSVIDTATNTVTATIPVGHNPNGIAVSAYNGLMCVTNFLSNDVSLVDPNSLKVVATVPVGSGPTGVARPPGLDTGDTGLDIPESFAYVANKTGNSVSVVEVGSARVIATIPVDASPDGVAARYDKVYVTHSVPSGRVSVIDTATNTVTASIPVGARPNRAALGPNALYVTNFGSFNISVIDSVTNAVTAAIGLSLKPTGIAITPDGRSIYVSNADAPIVSLISVRDQRVLAAIAVGAQPAAIAHIRNRPNAYTYVANAGSDTVSVINRAVDNAIVATIPVGHMPFALAAGSGRCAAVPTAVPSATPSQTPQPTSTPPPTSTVTPTPIPPTNSPIPTVHSTATTTAVSSNTGCAMDGPTPPPVELLWLVPLIMAVRNRGSSRDNRRPRVRR